MILSVAAFAKKEITFINIHILIKLGLSLPMFNKVGGFLDQFLIYSEFQRRQVLMFGTPFIISTKCSKGQNRKQEVVLFTI